MTRKLFFFFTTAYSNILDWCRKCNREYIYIFLCNISYCIILVFGIKTIATGIRPTHYNNTCAAVTNNWWPFWPVSSMHTSKGIVHHCYEALRLGIIDKLAKVLGTIYKFHSRHVKMLLKIYVICNYGLMSILCARQYNQMVFTEAYKADEDHKSWQLTNHHMKINRWVQ